MTMHVALLRGINVGGRNKVAMAELRDLCAGLGFAEVSTILQSGNLIFRSERRAGAALENLLEKETATHLGVTIDYLVRSAAEWAKIVARNPFPEQAKNDPGHLVVMCLKSAPTPTKVDTLRDRIKGPEILKNDGQQLYICYPDGIGRSKLTGTLIESTLGSRGTARNWNTVLKLAARVDA